MSRTLHEAMLIVLNETDGIPISRLVRVINETELYIKRDKSPLKNSQIYARVNKYPHLFYIENKCVYRRSHV